MTFRASAMDRRLLCPASGRLEEGLSDEDSAESREGTLLHSFLSDPKLVRAVLKPNQVDLLRIAEDSKEFVFNQVCQQFGISSDEPFEQGGGKEWSIDIDGVKVSGHTDDWRRYPRLHLVIVIDFKMGYRAVDPAASNIQLRCYAVMAVEEWPDTTRVAVSIIQPRLSFSERCTLALYERADIDASITQLVKIVTKAQSPDAPLHVTDSGCRWCKAKLICPAFQAAVTSSRALLPIGDGTVAKRQADIESILKQLSPDQRDSLINAVKFADFIREQLYDFEREVIASGGESHYQVGKASEMRKVADVKRAVGLLTLKGDLTRDDVLACCSMKLGDDGGLAEILRKRKKCTWQKARETIDTTLAPVLEKEPKKPSLTRK